MKRGILWLLGVNAHDPNDPIYRSYKRCFRYLRNVMLIGLALSLFLIFFGVPTTS